MKFRLGIFLIGSFLISFTTFGKAFTNQYCEFELPQGWECALEGSEWVCQSVNKDRQREAIIILAAKKRGPQDSLDNYQAYLKQTKSFKLPGGKIQVSEPKTAKMTMIHNHQWVDSLHLASEVPGFYTRYLATVKEDIGVAVTFSVAKSLYPEYQNLIENIVKTLKVFREGKAIDYVPGTKKDGVAIKEMEVIRPFDGEIDIGPDGGKSTVKKGGGNSTSLFILVAGIVVVFFVLKKLKAKK